VQFEVYFSNRKDLPLSGDALTEDIISRGIKMGLFEREDIIVNDARILPYGNIIFYEGMEADRKIVLDYLASLDIYGVGRFGKWEYLWTDQCVLTGRDIVAENF
jgi:protoporphyrinogen oxidase